MESATDENLMLSYQRGEEASFSELYRRYQGRLYGYLKKQNLTSEMTDEVYQGVWMKLHRHRFRYDPRYPFSAWLFTIARSALIDAYRKEKKFRRTLPAEALDLGSAETHEDPVGPVLEPAWELVKADDRRALQWRYFDEASFEEIGQRLGLSPVNVRQRISRALKKLRGKTT